jgi:hypothetical protein
MNDVERSEWNDGNAAGGVLDRRIRIGIPMMANLAPPVAESASSRSEMYSRICDAKLFLRSLLDSRPAL